MKRLLILLLFVTCSMVGQEFEITPFGFACKTNEKQSYVVLEFPGKTKAEIYKAVLVKLNSMYNSPKDVLSVVENESITINAVDSKRIRRTSLHSFKNTYTISLSFKDGKMKMDAPSFTLTNYYNGGLQKLHLMYKGLSLGGENLAIYSTKGTPKRPKAIQDLNSFANKYVTMFKTVFDTKSNDW